MKGVWGREGGGEREERVGGREEERERERERLEFPNFSLDLITPSHLEHLTGHKGQVSQ